MVAVLKRKRPVDQKTFLIKIQNKKTIKKLKIKSRFSCLCLNFLGYKNIFQKYHMKTLLKNLCAKNVVLM